MFEYTATLKRIVDADTYLLDVDLGFYTHAWITVRLRGANAPERFTTEGRAATRAVASWFDYNSTEKGITVRTFKADDTDKYGRWVADIIGKQQGSLSEWMVKNKYAVATDDKGKQL